jgi:prophage regulatory protein
LKPLRADKSSPREVPDASLRITLPRIIRARELCQILDIARTTLWVWVKDGHFPKPQQFGRNVVGWLEPVVMEWLRQRPTA